MLTAGEAWSIVRLLLSKCSHGGLRMSLEPGGRAAKLGNEYERLWGVHQMFRVLCGEAVSVLPEGLGPDERGVDVWVRQPDGTRVGHQCKSENEAKGKWSVADLSGEGVLHNAQYQLTRNSENRFAFVSSDPAALLRDLADRTGRCNDDPESFAEYLATTSKGHRQAYKQFAGYLALDVDSADGRARIYGLLCRIEFVRFDRGRIGREWVRSWCRLTVSGDPGAIVELLGGLLVEEIGNELHADQIRASARARFRTARPQWGPRTP